ncbi:MAG TPA: acyl-CoA dehydrogenase [Pseudonocardiaceae bacterium]|jgi:alkylation response protein AidB-like acyl-CoA dehydrogenase|nr:acyl-CoA dehydrogenase [Pseudonocardiaceae bacterium]
MRIQNLPVSSAALAESLEEWLGDPEVDSNSLSFSRALRADENDDLPTEGIERIRAFGFHRYFVPERLGGDLRASTDILMLFRVIARRDMNVVVSELTVLWMMLVWIGGTARQRETYAAMVLRGGVLPCLAYSEPEHGADLAASTLAAVADGGEYVLSGEKWPINRGSTSTHIVVLGTTGDHRSQPKRRQSIFLVERAQVTSGTVTGLPRVSTYGLRGCDISGLDFAEARVDASTRLGAEGEGLELALRGLLITRTFCVGLSLGTGDAMLRTAAGFLSERTLYNGPATEIPYVSESLANAYLSLLVAECASLVAMRGLHLHTEQFSIWGNIAKVQVARLVDANAQVLARTLGARYFMRAHEHVGTFQKMFRDGAVISLFDGSEPVCLDSIALQLTALVGAYGHDRDVDWRPLYDLRAELPAFEPHRVSVFGRGRDATFASLPALIDLLGTLSPSGGCDEQRLTLLRGQAEQLRFELTTLFLRVREIRRSSVERVGTATPTSRPPGSTKATPPALLRVAEELCALHVKVAALGIWLFNRDHLDGFVADGAWLAAALARGQVHQHRLGDLDPSMASTLVDRMRLQRANNKFFSVLDVRMAASGTREAPQASAAV